jgi:hypothetical protein
MSRLEHSFIHVAESCAVGMVILSDMWRLNTDTITWTLVAPESSFQGHGFGFALHGSFAWALFGQIPGQLFVVTFVCCHGCIQAPRRSLF